MNEEQTIRQDELYELEQYRRLLDHIPAELGVLDLEGRFLYNTPAGIQDPDMRAWIVGKTHHEYCGRRDLPISFADNRQNYIDQCINEKRTATFEDSINDRSGQTRIHLRFFSPVIDADGPAIGGDPRQITTPSAQDIWPRCSNVSLFSCSSFCSFRKIRWVVIRAKTPSWSMGFVT